MRRSETCGAPGDAARTPIHVLDDGAVVPRALAASLASFRAAEHPVTLWRMDEGAPAPSVSGVALRSADEVLPVELAARFGAQSYLQVFSYAVLHLFGGLWMVGDRFLLRPFPLQTGHVLFWRAPEEGEPRRVSGEVMLAPAGSGHMRALFERAMLALLEGAPLDDHLLTDHLLSPAGAELALCVLDHRLFDAVGPAELALAPATDPPAALSDPEVIGVALGPAGPAPSDSASCLAALAPPGGLRGLAELAEAFETDKNRRTGAGHGYALAYERLLAPTRFSTRRVMEIGLCRGRGAGLQTSTPSVDLWLAYFPFARVVGVDITDFSRFDGPRFSAHVCDQSSADDLDALVATLRPAGFDLIVDDGSHRSVDQQLTLRRLWPLLRPGGWYVVEDLDWRPEGEDPARVSPTKLLLAALAPGAAPHALDPADVQAIRDEVAEVRSFDSRAELLRRGELGGLGALRKRS